jgi:hypothetical protein
MSLKEELARIIAKKRVYASSDEGGPDVTDAQVDLGIVEDLLESMECSGEAIYVDVSGANPPDCIARGIGGERVAIEVAVCDQSALLHPSFHVGSKLRPPRDEISAGVIDPRRPTPLLVSVTSSFVVLASLAVRRAESVWSWCG